MEEPGVSPSHIKWTRRVIGHMKEPGEWLHQAPTKASFSYQNVATPNRGKSKTQKPEPASCQKRLLPITKVISISTSTCTAKFLRIKPRDVAVVTSARVIIVGILPAVVCVTRCTICVNDTALIQIDAASAVGRKRKVGPKAKNIQNSLVEKYGICWLLK